MSIATAPAPVGRTVHVEGRTPGPFGVAPMVTLENGTPEPPTYVGSHHEAVYLAAIVAMSDALIAGVADIHFTSPSEHLVNQMNGTWEVGPGLEPYHRLAQHIVPRFASVTWAVAPRTP